MQCRAGDCFGSCISADQMESEENLLHENRMNLSDILCRNDQWRSVGGYISAQGACLGMGEGVILATLTFLLETRFGKDHVNLIMVRRRRHMSRHPPPLQTYTPYQRRGRLTILVRLNMPQVNIQNKTSVESVNLEELHEHKVL